MLVIVGIVVIRGSMKRRRMRVGMRLVIGVIDVLVRRRRPIRVVRTKRNRQMPCRRMLRKAEHTDAHEYIQEQPHGDGTYQIP